jgi:hypothetical protein
MARGFKSGGRKPGSQNKNTRQLKAFLGEVFEAAFADPGFRAELLLQITQLTIDSKLLATLLAHYAGTPSQAVDHTHSGQVTLAQLVSGALPADVDDDDTV